MAAGERIQFREASCADAPAIALTHASDPAAAPADPRINAYLDGRHHPQQALAPRVAYLAIANDSIVGYIAGHRTTRHGCAGEVQYLFVSPEFRRQGVATELLKLLARWFGSQDVEKVCVALADDSPAAFRPFYERLGARPLKKYWHGWPDIRVVLETVKEKTE